MSQRIYVHFCKFYLLSSYNSCSFFVLTLRIHIACMQDRRLLPFMLFFQYNFIFCPRYCHWHKTYAMLEQACTHCFPSLCAVTSHWKLEVNNGGAFTPQRLANDRNQNLFLMENLLNFSFYTTACN